MIKALSKMSRKYSLGITMLAAPIFMLSLGVLYFQTKNMIHQEVDDALTSSLNASQHVLRNYMNTIETAASSNIWLMQRNFNPDSLQSISNRIVRINPRVSSSSVMAVPGMLKGRDSLFSVYTVNQGDTVVSYRETEYDYRDKAFYTVPMKAGVNCWIDPYKDNAEWGVDPMKAVATYCSLIKEDDGRIVGVLTTDFQFAQIAKLLKNVKLPYKGVFHMLLSGDGRYLVCPDSTRLFRKTIFTDADPTTNSDVFALGYDMTKGNHGNMYVKLDGKNYHVCYKPISGTDWSLALVCPDSSAMAEYHHLGNVIIAIIILGLLAILLFSHNSVTQLGEAIQGLIESTQKTSYGYYDQELRWVRRNSLIYKLQNNFIEMQGALKERMGGLTESAEKQRKINEELLQQKQQADETEMARSNEIRQVSQQLRMPLSVITGFADMLADDSHQLSESEMHSITETMTNEVLNMDRLLITLQDATDEEKETPLD